LHPFVTAGYSYVCAKYNVAEIEIIRCSVIYCALDDVFLCERQQRVKISDSVSDWVTLRGGVSQGSWLGPLIFIILTDDLRPQLLTHKFVDETTLSETIAKGSTSEMQRTVDELVKWSQLNCLNINSNKTKEWYSDH